MPEQQAIHALRNLYRAEFRCPTGRFEQASPFVTWADTQDEFALRDVAREDREHLAWLVDLLIQHAGGPPPVSLATNAAAAHYNRLEALLPQMIRDEQELIAAYQSASPALTDLPDAAAVAGRILQRHARHLETIQRLERRAPAAAH